MSRGAEGWRSIQIDPRGTVCKATRGGSGGAGMRVGLPLSAFVVENLMLPPVTPREVEGVAELQIEYHLPFPRGQALVGQEHRLGAGNLRLHFVALDRERVPQGAASAWPAPLALYGLAACGGVLRDDEDTLLVGVCDGEVLTVALSRGRVVFMRQFDDDGDLARHLRMSAQAVYLRERAFFTPQRIVLVGEADAQRDLIAAALPDADTIALDLDELFEIGDGIDIGGGGWTVPLGLAAIDPDDPALGPWARLADTTRRQQLVRRLPWLAPPALVACAAAVLYAGALVEDFRARRLQDQINELLPSYSAARESERDLGRLRDLEARVAPAVQSPRMWVGVLDRLERARPFRLSLQSVAGALDDLITIDGAAENYLLVSEYMTRLGNAPGIRSVQLVFTRVQANQIEFELTLAIDPSAIVDPLTDSRVVDAGRSEHE
jgi:hypothetical protein